MRVVGVDCHELGEAFPVGIGVIELEVADDGRKAGGDEQILLLKAQDATVLACIVGIQDFRDCLGIGAELRGSGVIATVECIKVEVLLCGLGAPQAQTIHGLAIHADDGHVIGDGLYHLSALLAKPELSAFVFMANNLSAKTNDDGALVMSRFPRVALVEPVIGYLDLASALDFLTEESVAVAHAVAKAQDALGSHGVEKACGKAAQTAIAQARVSLFGQDIVELDAHAVQALGDNIADTIVEQVVVEQGTKQELQREIVDLLLVAFGVFRVGLRKLLVCLLGN